jgi:hypothetical protein
MKDNQSNDDLIFRLKRQLPLAARCRPPLLAFLERRLGHMRAAPRLKVTNVLSTTDANGVLCQFVVEGEKAGEAVFVAPLRDIAFERRVSFVIQPRSGVPRRKGVCGK